VLKARTDDELDEAFASLPKMGATGLVVSAEPFFDSHREHIVALATRYAIAVIANLREYVVAGGLISYGASLPDSYRRAAVYAGHILKGDKPADLPVMQPTKYDLVINLQTANPWPHHTGGHSVHRRRGGRMRRFLLTSLNL
jgi:putative tryptophan/tyrosine transport system substrate-binding protein